MQNKILFEERIAVNNQNHVCSEIIKNYKIKLMFKTDLKQLKNIKSNRLKYYLLD